MEYDVVALAELHEDKPLQRRVGGKLMVLFRRDDRVFATGTMCPHWGAPMRDATIKVARNEIVCPWHRFRFDLESGACVASLRESADGQCNPRRSLQVYPTRVENGRVLVRVNREQPGSLLTDATSETGSA